MILSDTTFDSINENFRDISSGWLWSSDEIYDAGYRHVYQQPISVEAATLLDLRWMSDISATTITIRTDSFGNAPVIWAGYAELIQETNNVNLTSADIPTLPYLPLSGGTIEGDVFVNNISAISLNVGDISNTEFNFLDGVSANIQTQINQLSQFAISGVGTGTPNRLTKFVTSSSMGDSSITDAGSLVTFTTPVSSNNTMTAPNFTGLASRATSALQADTLKTARSFSLSGEVTSNVVSFDGSGNMVLSGTLASGINATKIADGTISNTEFQYLNTVSANIQTQFSNLSAISNNKANSTIIISGTSGLIGGGNLSSNRNIGMPNVGTPGTFTKVSTDQYGRVSAATNITSADIPTLPATKIGTGIIDDTEFNHLDGVSANIQTQLNQLSQFAISGVGTGTPNRITKFITSASMGDSSITDTGSLVTFTTPVSSNNTFTAPNFTGLASRATSALQSDTLKTARSFSLSGDVNSNVPTFNGSGNVVLNTTISAISWNKLNNVPTASSNTSGILTSSDWNTFNNKIGSLSALNNYLPLSGGTINGNVSANNISGTTLTIGNISNIEFQYLDNVSANIQTQLTNLSATKANSTVTITAGTMLSGGGDLSTNRTISHQTVGTAGTYSNIVTNSTGHITSARSLIAGDMPSGIDATKIANGTVDNTEFQYLDNVSANIQTQLTNLSGTKADKTVTITAGTMLSGGGDLSTNKTISHQTVGTAGTYSNIVTNSTGHITSARALISADIPTLPPSKILEDANDRFVSDSQINSWTGTTTTVSTNSANWNTASTNSHTHSNKATLDLINQSLNTSATVKFGNIDLGTGATVGATGNTPWLKIADFPDTGSNTSRKYYVSIMGGDWNDNAKIEYVFDSFATGPSQSAFNVARINTSWKHSANEIYSKLEWKALRRNSDSDYMVFVRGAALDYFTLAADVKYTFGSQGAFQHYITTSADGDLPTSATHTEVPVTVVEQPTRMLNDILFVRNVNLPRTTNFSYTDTSAVGDFRFDGTSFHTPNNHNLGRGANPWKDVYINGTYFDSGFAGGRALVTDSSKGIVESSVTSAQINYLNTTSANIQSQLGNLSAADTTINNRFNSYLPLSGGTLTGDLVLNRDSAWQQIIYRNNNTNTAATGIKFRLLNSVGSSADYSGVQGYIVSNTSGSHTGGIKFRGFNTGTEQDIAYFSPNGLRLGTTLATPRTSEWIYVLYNEDKVAFNAEYTGTSANSSPLIQANATVNLPSQVLFNGRMAGSNRFQVYGNGSIWSNSNISAVGDFYNTTYTGNRALISGPGKNLIESSVTDTELSYLTSVSANIQTQLTTLSGFNSPKIIFSTITNFSRTSTGNLTSAVIPGNTLSQTIPTKIYFLGAHGYNFTSGSSTVTLYLGGEAIYTSTLIGTGSNKSNTLEIDAFIRYEGGTDFSIYGMVKKYTNNGGTPSYSLEVISNAFTATLANPINYSWDTVITGNASASIWTSQVIKG